MVWPSRLASIIFLSFNFLKCWETAGIVIPKISLRSQGQSRSSSSNKYRIFNLTSLPASSSTLLKRNKEALFALSFFLLSFICISSAKRRIHLIGSIKVFEEAKEAHSSYLSKFLNKNFNAGVLMPGFVTSINRIRLID